MTPSLRNERLALLAPSAAAVLVLLPALRAGFVHDDTLQILQNPLLTDPSRIPVLWSTGVWAGIGSPSSWYRPLMMSSFAVEHWLLGFSAVAMHAVSVALYALLAGLAARLVRAHERRLGVACAAGLLFAVHPVNVEAAAWISARCELLAAIGGVGALLLHGRSLGALGGRAHWLRALASAAFAVGLFGKESAVAFAPGLLAIDVVAGASVRPAALLTRYWGYGVAGIGYLLLRSHALGSVSGGLGGPLDPLVFLGALGQGVTRLVWPVGLCIAPPSPGLADASLGVGVLAASGVGLAAALRRRSRLLVPLAFGTAQLCTAALGAARLGELADRYLLAVSLAAAWGIAALALGRVARSERPRAAALAAATAGLALLAVVQVASFHSDDALWSRAWRRNPHSVRAAINLAAARAAGEPRAALSWLDRAEALAPGDRQIALNRAVAAHQLGDVEGARRVLEQHLAQHPLDPAAHLRLGHLALDQEEWERALHHYDATLGVLPLAAEAWAGRGVALLRLGRPAEGRSSIERALEIDPGMENARRLRRLL